jgi:dTDP-4-dehydrorhamnose reductase
VTHSRAFEAVKPARVTRPRVLITGAAGQLASFVVSAFGDWDVVAHTRATLDLTDASATRRVVADTQPSVIVNCAAFNDVDGAESRPIDAFAVNAFAVRMLARAAEDAGATLVHYSTDFVFDGSATEPYRESDRPSPRSTYASSKLVGEWFALEAPGAFVLRVESLFGAPREWAGRRGTLGSIVEGLEQGRELRVFTDRIVSPAYSADIAAATRHLLETGAEPGLYHCVNEGHATWDAIAREAARVLGVPARLVPITMAEAALKAARPRYCALSPAKLAAAGFTMPPWQDALRRWLAVLTAKIPRN